MSQPCLTRTRSGPVVVLTMNRPEQRNALSRELVDQLSDALLQIGSDSSVRAAVITGAGPVFCAGMDLKEAAATGPHPEDERTVVADVQALADLIGQVHDLPKATIAALNGDAYAGGAGLAAACDFVLATPGVRIGYPEVRRGLVAAIVMHDLARQVGERRARQLLLSGAPIDAETAERWGLINRLVDGPRLLEEAIALGQSLLASAPTALATTKRLLDESGGRPADFRGPAAITASIRVGEEAHEGMRAFLEKRPPSWALPPGPGPA